MRVLLVVFVAVLMFMNPVSAQEEIIPTVRGGYLITSVVFQSWGSQEYQESMNQVTFPLLLVFPLSENFNLSISHTPGLSWWRPGYKLHGLSDTWIQGAHVFWDDRILVNAGVGVPTGKDRLTNPEFTISKDWLSRNIFKFRLPSYSQGLCGKLGIAVAYPITDGIVLGVGGQYLYRAAYHPLYYTYEVLDEMRVSDKEYQPGDEISGHLGVDFKISDDMKIMVDGIFTHYSEDLQEGEKVYGSGDKLNVNFAYYYRFDSRYLWSQLIYRRRGKNDLLQGLVLAEEEYNSNGDQLEFDFLIKAVGFERGGFLFMLDARYEGQNEAGKGDETIFGGGVGMQYQVADSWMVDIHFKYLTGWYRSLSDSYTRETVNGIDTVIGLKVEL